MDGSDVLLAPYQKRPKGTTRFCTSFMTKNMDIGSVVGNTAALDIMFKEGTGSQILRGPGPGRQPLVRETLFSSIPPSNSLASVSNLNSPHALLPKMQRY